MRLDIKLYFFATCPYSNIARILVKHCISNAIEEQISTRTEFIHLHAEKLPVLNVNNTLYYRLWPILIYLRNFYSKSMIDIFFKDANQLVFFDMLDDFIIEIYYNILSLENLYRLYNKSGRTSLEIAKSKAICFLKKYDDLLKGKHFLFNKEYTVCDVALFSIIASCEYFDIIDWKNYSSLFEWYLRCKSINMFNFILLSQIANYPAKPQFYSLECS